MENNKLFTAVERFSNQTYELFEQYSEGRFDRIQLNKLMVDATNKAKKMEKEQIKDAHINGFYSPPFRKSRNGEAEEYYNETFKSE